jgi:hypothetical protein
LYDRFYGPTRRWLAGRIVRLGMWAEVRRVKAAAGQGKITPDELNERMKATGEVAEMFVGLHGQQ